jgi:cell wall-associated NlpC family hydrolase
MSIYALAMRRLLLAVAVTLAVVPSAAAATPVAEIVNLHNRVLAAADVGAYAYPQSGRLLQIGDSAVTGTGVELRDVSLLGGRIQADRIFVPHRGKAAVVQGLLVDGSAVDARVNRLIPLSTSDYLIISQAAVASTRRVGLVGLRLSLGRSAFGLPAGAQILVGLPTATRTSNQPARARRLASRKIVLPLTLLGFTPGAPLAKLPPSVFEPKGGTTGERAVSIAERYLGIPYLWGGASPVTGFDCSGLMMYVYAQLGIHLTHYTGAQIHEGMPVPRWALQPGDLVFFHPGANGVPGHVGMYIGDGLFIQAPHTGDVVKISPLSDPSYALTYVGAVRPSR